MNLPRILLSPGDPRGVGPAVCVEAVLHFRGRVRFDVFGDANWFESRLTKASQESYALHHVDDWDAALSAEPGSPDAGAAQLRALDATIDAAMGADSPLPVVTGPTSKLAIQRFGVQHEHDLARRFVGQTEHCARRSGTGDDDVTMMFLGPKLHVALVTTHASVVRAAEAVTSTAVERTVRHMLDAVDRLGRAGPVAVAGLNPHAGEGGLFGREEVEHIEPALTRLAEEYGDRLVPRPVPAETAFRRAANGDFAAVVAMLHDQATIASKLLDWAHAVNVTWGLPFVRTSVDHGVAYDVANLANAVDPRGMIAAVEMALRLAEDPK